MEKINLTETKRKAVDELHVSKGECDWNGMRGKDSAWRHSENNKNSRPSTSLVFLFICLTAEENICQLISHTKNSE